MTPKTTPVTTGPRPGDFAIGSPESRAAARMLLEQPCPGEPIKLRVAKSEEEYDAYHAAVRAGRTFRYALVLGKLSHEDWIAKYSHLGADSDDR